MLAGYTHSIIPDQSARNAAILPIFERYAARFAPSADGSHLALVRDVLERMRAEGLGDIPVVVGGIIPPEDARALKALGVAGVYTPKDFQINDIMADIVRLVDVMPVQAAS